MFVSRVIMHGPRSVACQRNSIGMLLNFNSTIHTPSAASHRSQQLAEGQICRHPKQRQRGSCASKHRSLKVRQHARIIPQSADRPRMAPACCVSRPLFGLGADLACMLNSRGRSKSQGNRDEVELRATSSPGRLHMDPRRKLEFRRNKSQLAACAFQARPELFAWLTRCHAIV
jgi:hypothetical protein